jgi:para-nitrobenzyl esterase
MKRRKILPVLVAAAAATMPTVTFAQVVATSIAQGKVRGTDKNGIGTFLGIPFAAAPIGSLRWRAPQPVPRWKGERTTTRFSASCEQDTPPPGGFGPWTAEYNISGPVSEDCLYLNVWTPAHLKSERLPVMVWIHGGGFNSGSAAVPIYDGAPMASRGIVVVSINYRLGVYGFLANRAFAAEAGGGNGNFGLLDQIAALRWVQRNAAAFGGDPRKVTIAGQSAGAMSVHDLILSPKAKGLFHGAIAQSGSGMGLSPASLAQAEADGARFMTAAGAASAADLRALTPAQLSEAAKKSSTTQTSMLRFAPVADGIVIPSDPDKALVAGQFNDTPILTGLNADEASGMVPLYRPGNARSYRSILNARFGTAADRFAVVYPLTQPETSAPAMQRDRGIAGLMFWSESRARSSKLPIWRYLFTHAEPGPEQQRYGAFHSVEIPYVMGTLAAAPARPFTAKDHAISDTMGRYWANFIKTGNPNGPTLAPWPRVDDPNQLMELGENFGARPAMDPGALDVFRAYIANGGTVSIF